MAMVVLGVIIFGGATYFWLMRVRTAERAAVAERSLAQAMAAARYAQSRSMLRTAHEEEEDQQLEAAFESAQHSMPKIPDMKLLDVAPPDAAEPDITIAIDANGNVSVGDSNDIPLDWLGDRLKELSTENGAALTVAISADDACEFRHVADVVRQCEAVGIGKVRIAVKRDGRDATSPD
jgi:biopolymer transport protein ExbD